MLQKYNRYRVLREFFDSPTQLLHIRGIARRIGLGEPSVTNHLKALEKEGLVRRKKEGVFPSYAANRDEDGFGFFKRFDVIMRIRESGLLGFLHDALLPECIILFGSAARGEDIETSDVDIFVQSKEKKLELAKYERLLGRKISIFFSEDFNKLPKELKSNIINGVILKGYLEAF